ncbi:type II toxin-antitoxin system RelE/ParE family toxin [Sideroxydans lithotrophicus]|uniref:Addiction module toxin, RelE/StbE family n=1 Tax=Sideroxydans lithotrophicus (strain ES-1) TaxID=580332 RepID=D5CQG1_SIDLE|nr:type II toxin-antitoxin system mRNA interferase toxin, RelE/StbE family [Sideroxydans lithotrophicus]ADE13182.1 addiction module toxin, RelE/StbE family [Sideroxydans lithotrophicus ES-1]
MNLRYTPQARSDLAEIHDYIAQENPAAARRVVQLVRDSAKALPDNPLVGRPGRVPGTRELAIGRFPFVLAYRVSSDEVQILSVIHTARAWPESF